MLRDRFSVAGLPRIALVVALVPACGVRAEQQAFDEFAEEEADLRCTLASLCDDDSLCVSAQTHDFDRCDNFEEEEAQQCLDELQGFIEELETGDADMVAVCLSLRQHSCDPVFDAKPTATGCSTPPLSEGGFWGATPGLDYRPERTLLSASQLFPAR